MKYNKVLLYESFEICKMWDLNPRAFQHHDLDQELVLVRSFQLRTSTWPRNHLGNLAFVVYQTPNLIECCFAGWSLCRLGSLLDKGAPRDSILAGPPTPRLFVV